jgi:hypothetical protein
MSKEQNMDEYNAGYDAGRESRRTQIVYMIEQQAAKHFVAREQNLAARLLILADEVRATP